MSKTTGVLLEAGTAYPSRAPQFTPGVLRVHVARSSGFCVLFCRLLFLLLSFYSVITLFVLLSFYSVITLFVILSFYSVITFLWRDCSRDCRVRDRMVVGFTITYAISAYHHWCCEFAIRARCTTVCDKVCQWLAPCRWFSPGTPVSSTHKTDRHNITQILLKVALR